MQVLAAVCSAGLKAERLMGSAQSSLKPHQAELKAEATKATRSWLLFLGVNLTGALQEGKELSGMKDSISISS